ncbi:CbiX/SirB N-terminal domain-containing protein [Sedimentitalea arenosa]|uniref:Cobalamin biosynthesis protein CbiX n=1 Tax=Sedimentitalea arenosa TaxID=2798803 RepID=A0A8J7J984_9RHOB|nr:CbiX/SirB N-terminal domain-containing protein [Arenibacterium arenosum]MBJ6373087.1 cobalamin biosynthesis protein CbiX [Arenibacterium arenosum]
MSGTRSPSPKAQATDTAIIVSHGQPSEPDPAEAVLADLTARVAELMPGWRLASATLAKDGALDAAISETGRDALVYPLFMTDGWFTQTTLPKRLDNPEAPILSPLGTDPALPALAADWLAQILDAHGWDAADTCLIVASHGSGKSRNSARDTERFVENLSARLKFGDTRIGYIEEAPFLGDVAFETGAKAICLPFFAAEGGHVTDDIPEALDLAEFPGLRLHPIGTHEAIPALIADALRSKARAREAA